MAGMSMLTSLIERRKQLLSTVWESASFLHRPIPSIAPQATSIVSENTMTERGCSGCSLIREVGNGINDIAPRKVKFIAVNARDFFS